MGTNKSRILELIRNNSPIFKAEISRITHLSIPTVMRITDDLLNKKIIKESGMGESSGGKPPLLLEFSTKAFFIIGIEIKATKIEANILDLETNTIQNEVQRVKIADSVENIQNILITLINNLIINSGIDKAKILGIGIGMHGLVNHEQGMVIYSPDWNWSNVDLVSLLQKTFKMRVIIDNVNRAYATGEKWFGIGQNIKNFICLYLGYGIGSAYYLDGKLYYGSSGTAGEIGHFVLKKDGPRCDCGNHGCLESLSSSYALVREAVAHIESGCETKILDLAEGSVEKIEGWHVYKAAEEQDPLAVEILDDALEYLGIALAGLITFLDPEIIILEGEYAQVGDILEKKLLTIVDKYRMKPAGQSVRIVSSDLGNNAGCIGAGAMILEEFIRNGGEMKNNKF